jgi:predicted nucleotidyltransferase component of viral defense system
MGTQQVLNTSPERALHIQLMREIARDFQDLPMVLKGGTALLLCYGLDRFSEDLDFDALKPFNILPRVERVLSRNVHSYLVKIVKDTSTVQRLKTHYKGVSSERLLKIETSFRAKPTELDICMVDGIKTYKIEKLIEQKVNALANRTAARDLYDVAFLMRQYWLKFSKEAKQQLSEVVKDIDGLEQRFQDAFVEDEILDLDSLPTIILQINEKLTF